MTPAFPKPRLLVGYGNTLRSDDGVGPKLIEAIAALNLPGIHTLFCALLMPELAEPISRANTVIFVDAAVDKPRRVLFRKLAPAASSRVMTHAPDPCTILALARDVFGHAPPAWLLTIPIENTTLGENLSEFTQRGLTTGIEKIRNWLPIWAAPSTRKRVSEAKQSEKSVKSAVNKSGMNETTEKE